MEEDDDDDDDDDICKYINIYMYTHTYIRIYVYIYKYIYTYIIHIIICNSILYKYIQARFRLQARNNLLKTCLQILCLE